MIRRASVFAGILSTFWAGAGHAQPSVASPTADDAPAAPATPSGTAAAGSTSTSAVYTPPFGVPYSGKDPNSGLPSSSRPSSGNSSDTFDLGQPGSGETVVRGNKGSIAITGRKAPSAIYLPDIYTVKRGDTLWDICDHYYENPWQWPKLWSYNPDIRNPNWIYPGDQLRLSGGGGGSGSGGGAGRSSSGLAGQKGAGSGGKDGALGPNGRATPDTLFLRDEAYIGDPDKDTWGEVVGAREEQMLLSRGNHVYLDVKPGVEPQIGQEVTLFETLRKPDDVEGARNPPGEIVRIKGTVKITEFDPKKKMATGEIVESVDAVERGCKVGDVERKYRVVSATTSSKTVWARVLTSVHPHVYMGQHQLVFIDKGSEDGLAVGNRLLVVRRGDSWRRSLAAASSTARDTLRIDSPKHSDIRTTTLRRDDKDFPEEIIAELRLLKVSPYSSAALVSESQKEIVVGDQAVAREGY